MTEMKGHQPGIHRLILQKATGKTCRNVEMSEFSRWKWPHLVNMYIVLYYIILYYTILYDIILYYMILYYLILYDIILYYMI
jgi:hypothetical protein